MRSIPHMFSLAGLHVRLCAAPTEAQAAGLRAPKSRRNGRVSASPFMSIGNGQRSPAGVLPPPPVVAPTLLNRLLEEAGVDPLTEEENNDALRDLGCREEDFPKMREMMVRHMDSIIAADGGRIAWAGVSPLLSTRRVLKERPRPSLKTLGTQRTSSSSGSQIARSVSASSRGISTPATGCFISILFRHRGEQACQLAPRFQDFLDAPPWSTGRPIISVEEAFGITRENINDGTGLVSRRALSVASSAPMSTTSTSSSQRDPNRLPGPLPFLPPLSRIRNKILDGSSMSYLIR
ncbi:hypothetical protein B0H10DRAFT_709814 [Mycena sp. CBHHK59/15]|nr:hypothetical protein B0H10DRAFT_709814 [Mycena sp. CBHHK59/15]